MTRQRLTTYEDVIQFLDSHPGKFTYGQVAQALGYSPGHGGRAIGAMMRALHNRGLHSYCKRVVNTRTGEHGCA